MMIMVVITRKMEFLIMMMMMMVPKVTTGCWPSACNKIPGFCAAAAQGCKIYF